MRAVCILIFSIIVVMESFSQAKITDRQTYAAGRFYPADKTALTDQLANFFSSCRKTPADGVVRAIIAPHAGYVFSGKTAAAAFSAIPENAEYKNVFIIGSSHVMSFDGASVYSSGDYITPLGKMPVNREISNKLIIGNKVFNFPLTAHLQEHSLEVQVPFIQYHLKKCRSIVPIVIGTNNRRTIMAIAEALKPYFTPENLFVISSDFSHYPQYDDAVVNDKQTAMGIVSNKPELFLSTLEENSQKHVKGLATSMCGWTSGLTLMYLTEGDSDLQYQITDYTNSGDSPYGGKDEVVGYNAIIVTQKQAADEPFSFNDSEKKQLFTVARNSIRTKLFGEKISFSPSELSIKLSEPAGVFVTLKIDGNLRGCIGRFISSEPLYKVVQESAVSSAFGDPRFSPLTKEEYPRTEFEITVLGPLKKISSIDQIILGRHGIYIKKDFRSGTMLPQVATENGWTREQFLGYTARDKAGIGWDGWKDAELYIYEGLVLEEDK